MTGNAPDTLTAIWPDEAIEAMAAASREVLATVGVRVDSETAQRAMLAAGCAPGTAGRVLVPAAALNAALASCPREFTLLARDRAKSLPFAPEPGDMWVHNSGEDPNVADPLTGVNRPSTLRDQALAARVMHHLRYPHTIGSLFWPSDVPAELQPLYSFLALARETDKHVSSPLADYGWQTGSLAAMAEAIAASDPVRDEYSFHLALCPVSPLQLSAEVCEGLLALADHPAAVEILPAPMAGTTAPGSLAGGLVQQHAEILAGIVLAQAVRPGTACYAGARLGPTDPRTGEAVGGAPEGSLASLAATLLARRDGLACDCYGPLSGAQVLDLQAGLEEGVTLLLSMLSRPRFLSGCGVMQGTASCLEALVVHDQLFAHAFNGLTVGRRWDEEALAVEAIRAAVLGGKGFLAQKHTRRALRYALEPSRLGFHGGLDEWLGLERASVVDEARARVEELVVRAPLGLPAEVDAELCAIIDRTARERGLDEWPDPRRSPEEAPPS